MVLLESRKFSRWSDERSREHRRRHAATMRRLARERAESEGRHAVTMRELEARIAAMRGPQLPGCLFRRPRWLRRGLRQRAPRGRALQADSDSASSLPVLPLGFVNASINRLMRSAVAGSRFRSSSS